MHGFTVVRRAGASSGRFFRFSPSAFSSLHATRRFLVMNTSIQPTLSWNIRSACSKTQLESKSQPESQSPCQSQKRPCEKEPEQAPVQSALSLEFWSSPYLWKRAGINTFRCLIGCSLGDFSAMWFLQAYYPDLSVGLIMGVSSKFFKTRILCFTVPILICMCHRLVISGLSTSMLLETVLLQLGRDQLTWITAAKTAAGMSMVSMLGMETVQNLVDYHLTSGVVTLDDPKFWIAAAASAFAGFLAPLPYNYSRLKKYGKGCH